jgi:hypothetical protein
MTNRELSLLHAFESLGFFISSRKDALAYTAQMITQLQRQQETENTHHVVHSLRCFR